MAVQYYVASSLDGFIAAPGDDLDWLLQFGMEEFQPHYDRFIADVGAIVMGSATYRFIIGQGPEAWPYGETPTWVLTSQPLVGIDGADLRFVGGDITEVIGDAREAAGDANVWVVGGGRVAAQVADAELLDELHVTVMPIVLGSGTPLLPAQISLGPLQLLKTTPFESGAVELVYGVHEAG